MRYFTLGWPGLTALALVFASVACARQQAPSPAASDATTPAAQTSPQAQIPTASPVVTAPGTGSIEGTLTDSNGVPPVVGGSMGVPITLKAEGADVNVQSNPTGGGFFAIRNLKPGTYEMFVQTAHHPDKSDPLRPVRVFGITVEEGKRTLLNIKMQPGQELEEIGKPVLTMQKFVNVSEELERLQAQIDELKKK